MHARATRFLRVIVSWSAALLILFMTSLTVHAAQVEQHTAGAHAPALFHFEKRLVVPLESWCFDTWAQTDSYAYLADANTTQIDVVNLRTMQVERPIGTGLFTGPAGCTAFDFSQMGPSGLATDRQQHLWASNGASSVLVFDLQAGGKLIKTMTTGGQKRTDGIAYDSQDNLMLVANAEETHPFLSLIDARNFRILAVLPVASAEVPVWDAANHRFLLSMPGTATGEGGGIAVLPMRYPFGLRIVRVWSVPHCAPAGLTLGSTSQALVGCRLGGAALLNTHTGRILPRISSASTDIVTSASHCYALATMTGPTSPGSVVLLDQRGHVLQEIATAPVSHSVLLRNSNGRMQLFIPEKGRGILVYEEDTSPAVAA